MNRWFLAAIVLLCLSSLAQADVFNLGPGLTNLETVTVGDPGNAADTASEYGQYGQGSVAYTYGIGKYEVTAAQYCDFLNHKAKYDPYGLFNTEMSSNDYGCKIQRSGTEGDYNYSVAAEYANRPVNYVSFLDAYRFTNWLDNGQGDGDTETGAYTLNGYTGYDGRDIQRNPGWTWAVTSNDEWYKAAYYKGSGTNSGYWLYATRTNTPDIDANTYNSVGHTTDVGSYAFSSAYGTYDQCGNVWEWTDTIVYPPDGFVYRALHGGSFESESGQLTPNCFYGITYDYSSGETHPTMDDYMIGFRVSTAVPPVPEPSSILALIVGLGGLGGMIIRNKK